MRTEAYYRREYVDRERSTIDIANEHGTYPNRIRRELINLGFRLRSKGEAQSAALRHGRTRHPTAGQVRSDDVRRKISLSVTEAKHYGKA